LSGSGEHHGCPFKEYDEKNLKHALEQYKDQKFTDDHIREILEYKRGKHFQVP
jgi:Eukaryotic and archaeal DNA primase, large subunit.